MEMFGRTLFLSRAQGNIINPILSQPFDLASKSKISTSFLILDTVDYPIFLVTFLSL